MTHPNPYGQQPYGGPPQGQQYGQQPYGSQPQNFGQPVPQPPVGNQHAPSFDDAEDPSGFGGLFARPRHLTGRVVIYLPKRVDDKAKGIDGGAKDTPNIHGDLLVVDGGMIEFGDKLKTGGIVERPCTHRVMAPAFFKNVIVGEQQVALALQQATPPFGNGLMVGVIVRGTKGNNPYLLQTLDRDDPRRQAARQLYDAWRSGAWTSPEPEPIQVVPGSQAMPQGMTPVGGQQYAPQSAPPAQGFGTGFAAAAGQWGQPQTLGGQATAWGGAQAPQSAPPVQGWGQQPQQATQTLPAVDFNQPAPGWDPAQWGQLPEANRQQIWQAVMAQQAASSQQANPGATSGPTGF